MKSYQIQCKSNGKRKLALTPSRLKFEEVEESGSSFAGGGIVRRAHIFSYGWIFHPFGDVEVNGPWASRLISNFDRFQEEGYDTPLLEEHEPRGKIFGLVKQVYQEGEKILSDFDVPGYILEEIKAGQRPYLSPSFWQWFTHPHTGEDMQTVLAEVSFVSLPHLKNIAGLRDAEYKEMRERQASGRKYSFSAITLEERSGNVDEEEEETTEEAPEEAPEEEENGQAEEDDQEDMSEEGGDADGGEAPEAELSVEELQAEVEELRAENSVLADFCSLSVEELEPLIEVRLRCGEETYKAMASKLSAPAPASAPKQAPAKTQASAEAPKRRRRRERGASGSAPKANNSAANPWVKLAQDNKSKISDMRGFFMLAEASGMDLAKFSEEDSKKVKAALA